jgi:hypothetical protein
VFGTQGLLEWIREKGRVGWELARHEVTWAIARGMGGAAVAVRR